MSKLFITHLWQCHDVKCICQDEVQDYATTASEEEVEVEPTNPQ